MSQNSVVGQVVGTVSHAATHLTDFTHPDSNTVFGQVGHALTHLSDLTGGSTPAPQAPATPIPDVGSTTQNALQAQVQREQLMRMAGGYVGGGNSSLLENSPAPAPASRILLGGN